MNSPSTDTTATWMPSELIGGERLSTQWVIV